MPHESLPIFQSIDSGVSLLSTPRVKSIFGTLLKYTSTQLPALDGNGSPRRRPNTQRITFQSIGACTEQQQQQAAIIQVSIDDLWSACVLPTSAFALDFAMYSQLHLSLDRFCGLPLSTLCNIQEDWNVDAQNCSAININRFNSLFRQFGDEWCEKLHLSSAATLLSTLVQEIVYTDTRCLKPLEQVHTSSTATKFRALLAMQSTLGYWDLDTSLAAVLGLEPSEQMTRFQITELVYNQLNTMSPNDAEWVAIRLITQTWLSQHHFDMHHDDIQNLILRLNVRFDVATLMQMRLEPLEQQTQQLMLQALMSMDETTLVHTVEWLRSLSSDIWRVFASPIGLNGLCTPQDVAKYFVRLAHFTLSASLYRFLTSLGILEKQELLLYLHSLTAAQYGQVLEGIHQPLRGHSTAKGVGFMLSFYFSLSSNARLTLLQELKQMQPIVEYKPTNPTPLKTNYPRESKQGLQQHLPYKRKVHKPGLQPLESYTKPIKSSSSSVSVAQYKQNSAWQTTLTKPKIVLMNGGVYRPSTSMNNTKAKLIDPDRRQLELAYLNTPHISVRDMSFPFPESSKRNKSNHIPLDSIGGTSKWIPPVIETCEDDKT
ncbi:hypothetical protein THRCLA_04978 [Thraustotheca clavata]|uniref:Uncharacterized protein n=1 Tax=Thraustotheca clavata TaxID=74557 RepID=A0A1V9ZXB8_9STRA|nr:hypothetical protein THRCLA_04978 [Thraustotheca clavata]